MKRYSVYMSFIVFFLVACQPTTSSSLIQPETSVPPTPWLPEITPMPTRPVYSPGQLVEYTAQSGDTLISLASHFNTSIEEIQKANPIIPETATSLPMGLPMQIPIYYRNFWGSSFQVLPNNLFVNGPDQLEFDTKAFIASHPGWLNEYSGYVNQKLLDAAETIDLVALNYSISPRLLLTLIEYHSQGLSRTEMQDHDEDYALGFEDPFSKGLFLQLTWAANLLNNGYYGWQGGQLIEFERQDGTLERPDPWLNAATVGFHILFNQMYTYELSQFAISPAGFVSTYTHLFGDPWLKVSAHIPGSLNQPGLILPFEANTTWYHTGGPHSAWGDGQPLAALDFAPPLIQRGCAPSAEFALAVANGLVVRSGEGLVVLDLDQDGDERTGWVIVYLHLATLDRAAVGEVLSQGDHVGHPSCEGGNSTGTHVHISRKYNGEWMLADSALPFNMEGWIPHNGSQDYQGTLTRYNQMVVACECANPPSKITATGKLDFLLP